MITETRVAATRRLAVATASVVGPEDQLRRRVSERGFVCGQRPGARSRQTTKSRYVVPDREILERPRSRQSCAASLNWSRICTVGFLRTPLTSRSQANGKDS